MAIIKEIIYHIFSLIEAHGFINFRATVSWASNREWTSNRENAVSRKRYTIANEVLKYPLKFLINSILKNYYFFI